MAIISYGYPETITPGSTFADVSRSFGKEYSVGGFADLRVSASVSGTRRVNIASGWAMGKGVLVHNDVVATLDLPAPSGSSQWFLVGLHRWEDNPSHDPGATPPDPDANLYISEFTYTAGTSSRAVPSVTQDAGVDDTQWLALCRVTSGSTQVQEILDLRLVAGQGGGGLEVFSDLAMQQLEGFVGSRVYRGDTGGGHTPGFYERISSTSGDLSWKNMSRADTVITGISALAGPSDSSIGGTLTGWQRQGQSRLARDGQWRWLHLVSYKGGSNIESASTTGAITDQHLGVLHSIDRPPHDMAASVTVRSVDNFTYWGGAHITSFGNIYLNSWAPGVPLGPAGPSNTVTLDAVWLVP